MNTVDIQELAFALSFMKDIVPTNPHPEIYANILVVPEKDHINIYGRNFDKEGKISIACQVTDDRPFIIRLKEFSELITQLKKNGGDISLDITASGKTLKVKDARGETSFRLQDPNDYPSVNEDLKIESEFEIEAEQLAIALSMATFTQTDLLILTGIHAFTTLNPITNKTQICFESTNKYSGGQVLVNANIDDDIDLIFPGTLERAVRRITSTSTVPLKFEIGLNTIRISEGDLWYVKHILINGSYPDTKPLYNNCSALVNIEVERQELLDVLKRVSIVIGDSNEVTFEAGNNELIISTKSVELGESEQTIGIQDPGTAKVKVFAVELQRVLQQLTGDKILIMLGKANEPVLFNDELGQYFTLPCL